MSTKENQIALDTQLNKTILELVLASAAGYGVGIGLSLFFKQKSFIRTLSAGLAGGYQFNENYEIFNQMREKKN
ncbi:hypothetical protein pb186bvf_011476 [Paramecium bursaria]